MARPTVTLHVADPATFGLSPEGPSQQGDRAGARTPPRPRILGRLGAAVLVLFPVLPAAADPGKGPPPTRATPPQAAAQDPKAKVAAPLETRFGLLRDPEMDGRQALELKARALAVAIDQAQTEIDRLKKNVDYLNTRYVQKMQVSWSACGGRRPDTATPSGPLSLPLLGNTRESAGAYRYPRGTLVRYDAFKMNKEKRIVGQFRTLSELPAKVVAGLQSVDAGFRYASPNGDVYARYFDFLIVTRELRVVAAYRRGPPDRTGARPLEMFPPGAKNDPRAAYRSFARYGPRFPAVITGKEVSPAQFQRYLALRDRLLRVQPSPGFWLHRSPGRLLVWEQDLNPVKYNTGARHVLVPKAGGPIDFRESAGPGVPQQLAPCEDSLVIQGTEMTFGDKTLPGIAEGDERLEEVYRQGGVMVPDPEGWRRLTGTDRASLQDRPPKIVPGKGAIPAVEEMRQRRMRQVQQRLNTEVDPEVRASLDRQLYCLATELWWHDDQDYLYMIFPCPEDEEARWRRARADLVKLWVGYWAVRMRLFLLQATSSEKQL